ncbi:MAG: HupE/UreJ family protein [Planctomycetota bacterium]|nr:MAG: HupE/UreJ family protein [Planctomycetota bacterium]
MLGQSFLATMLAIVVGLPSLAWPKEPGLHPGSMAYLEIQVDGRQVEILFKPQGITLAEVPQLAALDLDQDGHFSGGEIHAGWPLLKPYLESGLALSVEEKILPLEFADYVFLDREGEVMAEESPASFARLQLSASLLAETEVRELEVAYGLFFEEGNPDHKVALSVAGLSPKTQHVLLDREISSMAFPLAGTYPSGPAFLAYSRLGFEHVLEGFDHLAFLLALLFGIAGWRALVTAVTAFTLAHSLTLSLSALNLFRLAPEIVEPGISLSIVLVLWLHLALGPTRARAWAPAFAFGLLHGFGFAGVLGEIGLPPEQRLGALFGFNLGVEIGQLAFLLPVAAASTALGRWLPPDRRREWRRGAAAMLATLGLYLSANIMQQSWALQSWPSWPEDLRGLPFAAGLSLLLALVLGRRRDPEGFPLLPVLGFSVLLYGLFLAGRVLGS